MSNFSFEINKSHDFYMKLLEEHNDFKKNRTSSRFAINCAMNAWHLIDWVYYEYETINFKDLKLFQSYCKNNCSSFQIMHDITNGAKHFKLDRHKSSVSDSYLHEGEFDDSFDSSFNVSSLVLKDIDGQTIYFETEIRNVIEYWENYFKDK